MAGGDDAAFAVADDQCRRRTRVVVLEKFEQKPEAALAASEGLTVLVAFRRRGTPCAVRTDKDWHE
jgi:hypothetical protein